MHAMSSPTRAGSSIGYTENRGFQFHSINPDPPSTYTITAGCESADCLHIGPGGGR